MKHASHLIDRTTGLRGKLRHDNELTVSGLNKILMMPGDREDFAGDSLQLGGKSASG
jgi:hypothetical protein